MKFENLFAQQPSPCRPSLRCLPIVVLVFCGVLMPLSSAHHESIGQEPAILPGSPPQGTVESSEGKSEEPTSPPEEEARDVYLGRRVAQFMTFHGAGWLIRDSRNREEATDLVMKQLELKPGMNVCDLGCGNGYYTLRFARLVAPRGTVFAVDIQPEMLQMLAARTARARLDGVKPVQGEVSNPHLPDGELDMVFMADVYHEFSHPESMLYWIRRSLKPSGVIALAEYREEDITVPIKPDHKMSKAQIIKEYKANGLKLVREFNGLPWQHLMFFARDDSPLAEIEPEPWGPQ